MCKVPQYRMVIPSCSNGKENSECARSHFAGSTALRNFATGRKWSAVRSKFAVQRDVSTLRPARIIGHVVPREQQKECSPILNEDTRILFLHTLRVLGG